MNRCTSAITHARSSRWLARWATAIFSALLTTAVCAAPADDINTARDVASRVGPVVGSALACPNITPSHIQSVIVRFRAVIKFISSNEADRENLTQLFERSVTDGRTDVTTGKVTCEAAERQFTDLEQAISISTVPAPSSVPSTPSNVTTATAPAAGPAAPTAAPMPQAVAVRGITDDEIRFGIAAPFSGTSRALGHQMEIGVTTAFNRINDAGGVNGRMLRLISADDGYEPTRTLAAMKQLYEKDQVFANIGNVGTPTAVVALPYVLEHRVLFFGAFTGAGILRNTPPDRYVFNYRASYEEETDAVVRYLLKVRHLQPSQIAVFAQQDAYGDAGFAGVAKAFRSLGLNDAGILRVNYKRNTIDVDDAINTLREQRPRIGAVVMVAAYRAAAKFIEKTRDLFPRMIYTNVSFVGSTELANELMLLGPRFANGVIVTQVVPAVGGYSSAVLEYKNALAKYFPAEAPDYVSLEGYVTANLLIEGLKRTGPQINTEKLTDTLENMRDVDLGLGTLLSFGRAEHQASHKVWATVIDDKGNFQHLDLE